MPREWTGKFTSYTFIWLQKTNLYTLWVRNTYTYANLAQLLVSFPHRIVRIRALIYSSIIPCTPPMVSTRGIYQNSLSNKLCWENKTTLFSSHSFLHSSLIYSESKLYCQLHTVEKLQNYHSGVFTNDNNDYNLVCNIYLIVKSRSMDGFE